MNDLMPVIISLILILLAIIMAVIAKKKGFSPWLWILTSLVGGVPGILILLFLPSANAVGITEEIVVRRKKVGNITGLVITIIAVILITVIVIFELSSDGPLN